MALKLSRALYGTRQTSALWNRLLTELLLELGFEQPLELDNCLFAYDREGTFIMCTLQVDDSFCETSYLETWNAIVEKIERRYDLSYVTVRVVRYHKLAME